MKSNSNSAIKVSLYLHNLDGGGAERSMVILSNGLSALGYSVELVLNQKSGEYFKELDTSVRVVSLNSQKRITHIWRLAKYLKMRKPKVLISTNVAPNYWAVIANHLTGKQSKLVLREANTPGIEFSESNIRMKLGFFLARMVYRFADAYVGNSIDSVESMTRFYKLKNQKVSLIYNAIQTDQIIKLAREPVIHKWIDNNEKKLIVTVGRMVKQKNHKMLIKALSYANRSHDIFRLIIIGSRGLDKVCEEEVERLIVESNLIGKVDFVNFTLNPFKYMDKADIFILSSKWEGFPSVLAQSMACGAQIISTDCPGAAREILSDGKYGTLVPVDDWKAMGEAILNAEKNQRNPELLIKRAKEFSVDKNAFLYSRLIKKILNLRQDK